MGQTLNHGVYLPAEGERNCYSGLASNWNLLDTAIGDIAGKASATHTHGNITNDGKVGTTANLPLITGTGGAIQAGSFGNSANTFCEGNDSRLSDARTPVAHTHGKADVTDLFNSANTWSGNQTYSGVLSLSSSSDVAEQIEQKLPKDVSTSNDAMARVNSLVDSAGHYVVVETLGHWSNYVAKNTTLKYKNDSAKQGAVELRLYSNGSGIFYPQSPFGCDLGNAYNKWKSLNGINPGALSLPDYNNYLDVTSNIPVASLDGTQIDLNTYLADKTGWLSIVIADTAGNYITVTQGRAGGSTVFNNSRTFHTGAQSNGYISVFFPIIAGTSKTAFIKASSLIQMRFYYCLGNV